MSIRSRGIPPRQFIQPQQPRPMAPAPQMQPRPALSAAAMGDPGYGSGVGVSPVDLRRVLDPIQGAIGEMQNRLASVEGSVGGIGALQEMLRMQPQQGFSKQDMLAGLSGEVIEAIRFGRALPYVVSVDVFVPKGVTGVQLPAGEIFISSDGPMFITEMLVYSQIDPDDADAANYPFSLIKSPSCCPGSTDVFAQSPDAATFTANPTSLLPSLSAAGRFIPNSPKNCNIISPTVETVCYTLDCANGSSPKSYSAQVPVVLLDHPECVDGLVDIQTNGCSWQNQSFPIAFLEDAMFNITANTPPDVIGVVGYLDCNKRLDVRFQPTRPMRYDVNITFLFAGFRVITCGVGGCGVG